MSDCSVCLARRVHMHVCVRQRESEKIFWSLCLVVCVSSGFSFYLPVETDSLALSVSVLMVVFMPECWEWAIYTLSEQVVGISDWIIGFISLKELLLLPPTCPAAVQCFKLVFVNGTFRAGLSLRGQQKALRTELEREKVWKIFINMSHKYLLLDAYCSCYNNKQSSRICLNIQPVSQVSWIKICYASDILFLFCCFILYWPRGQEGGWETPLALFSATVLLSHPLSSNSPQGPFTVVCCVILRWSLFFLCSNNSDNPFFYWNCWTTYMKINSSLIMVDGVCSDFGLLIGQTPLSAFLE